MCNNIEGKVVLVTDASSGLDAATTPLLSERSATAVLGTQRAGRIQLLAAGLTSNGGRLSVSLQTSHTVNELRNVDVNEILFRPTRQEL